MVESVRTRFAEESAYGRITIYHENLKNFYADVEADLTLAVPWRWMNFAGWLAAKPR